MDKSFHQDEPQVQQPAKFLIRLPIINTVFKWLASQIEEPTKEEQEDAGVYLGGEGRD
jgi:hypothetical protein